MIMLSPSQRGDFMPESTTHVSDNETARLNGGASGAGQLLQHRLPQVFNHCLLYTSDAADE